jgi:hypothetical protein
MKSRQQKFKEICNSYVHAFCKKQELVFDYWIADEVGEIASFSESYFFDIFDIMRDIDSNHPPGLVQQWQDDGVEAHFKDEKTPMINYKSYCMGLRYENLK